MASLYPMCQAPINVSIATTANSFTADWGGAASLYRLSYKREEEDDTHWVNLTQDGPGSSGGSNYLMDDTGDETTATGVPNASAHFAVGSLATGIYELKLVNVCDDGSSYVVLEKVFIAAAVTRLTGLALLSKTDSSATLKWDALTSDTGEPLLLTWQEFNREGDVVDVESVPLDHTALEFTLQFLEGRRYRFMLGQQLNEWQYNYSEPLMVVLCKCGGGEDCDCGGEDE